jgi:hypothetical protein
MDIEKNSIRGWELENFDPELFDLKVTELAGGCKNCAYLSDCALPSESIRQLTPKKGNLVKLAQEETDAGDTLAYYALEDGGNVRFILFKEPKYYWATASYISEDQAPAWAPGHMPTWASPEIVKRG